MCLSPQETSQIPYWYRGLACTTSVMADGSNIRSGRQPGERITLPQIRAGSIPSVLRQISSGELPNLCMAVSRVFPPVISPSIPRIF